MEFNFDCCQSLGCDQEGFAILEGSYLNRVVPGYVLFVKEIVNSMGEASSIAQNLSTIITSADKFFSSNHRIFMKAEGNRTLGFLKVGYKKLFLRDRNYNYHETNSLCVLDFYVHESVQRRGIGKQLFDYMLEFEKKNARELAYDRPSPKLLNFLRKYFGLQDFIRQNNNFLVFDEFFDLVKSGGSDMAYDNDTNRAIKKIITLPNYNNRSYSFSNNNGENSSPNLNNNDNLGNNTGNNYRPNEMGNNNYNNNDYPPVGMSQGFGRTSPIQRPDGFNNGNDQNNNNLNQPRRPTPMSVAGERLVYSNSFSNKVINNDVYKNPTTGFMNYYLNNGETTAYDNIYSKKKINLINDYLSSKKQTPYEFVSEQIGIKENSINNSNGRLNELMNKISDIKNENRYRNDELYNKRIDYATIFDDKKLVEYNYKQQNAISGNNSITKQDFQNYQANHIINGKKSPQALQHYTPFSNLGKVYTKVLPTSSSAYGSYFNNEEINNGNQSPNRIYY